MPNLLVFAGTTEGRSLFETISGAIDGSGLTINACEATITKDLLPGALIISDLLRKADGGSEDGAYTEKRLFSSRYDSPLRAIGK
jgi:hypothetical protein